MALVDYCIQFWYHLFKRFIKGEDDTKENYQDYTSSEENAYGESCRKPNVCDFFKKGDLEVTHCAEESRTL